MKPKRTDAQKKAIIDAIGYLSDYADEIEAADKSIVSALKRASDIRRIIKRLETE